MTTPSSSSPAREGGDLAERPAAAAVVELLQPLRAAAVSHEAAVVAGLDAAALHDFRVALRRARAALGLLRRARPPAAPRTPERQLAGEIRWLARETSAARDLDVLLAELPALAERLPESARRGGEPLEAALRSRRGREQARIVAAVESPRGRRLMRAWAALDARPDPGRAAVAPPAHGGADLAPPTLGALLAQRVRARRATLDARLEGLDEEGSAPAFHRARIAGKKLRYLLEFFPELLPPEGVAAIDDLRGLQDALGALNDREVQAALLAEPGFGSASGGEPERRHLEALAAVVDRDRRALRGRTLELGAAWSAAAWRPGLVEALDTGAGPVADRDG